MLLFLPGKMGFAINEYRKYIFNCFLNLIELYFIFFCKQIQLNKHSFFQTKEKRKNELYKSNNIFIEIFINLFSFFIHFIKKFIILAKGQTIFCRNRIN